MAEGAPLLREYGSKPIEGSNPSLSARYNKGAFSPFVISGRKKLFEPEKEGYESQCIWKCKCREGHGEGETETVEMLAWAKGRVSPSLSVNSK